MHTPRISVVTVSYNQAEFLEETILSVLNQNYPDLEYIVIDGGSSDGSVDIIKQYENELTYWVSEPDGGQSAGLIKGFDKSTGDIQCWINSDDLLELDALRDVVIFFEKNPKARVVTGDAILIDENGSVIRKQKQIKFYRFLWFNDHNYITQSSTFWRSDLYKEVGGLDPKFHYGMDADLFIRFADVTKMHHVRKFWSKFRIYNDQKTSRDRKLIKSEHEVICQPYFKNQSYLSGKAKRIIARVGRIGLKLISGCYWP